MLNETEIFTGLSELFRDIFQDDTIQLSEAMTAEDVQGWDSFKQIEIILAAESRWRVRFNPRELDGMRCVGDLARAIAVKAA